MKSITLFARVTNKEKVFFARQLAVMISAGLALDQSINLVKMQTRNVAFRNVLEGIAKDIDAGEPLSVAMAKYPKVFDNVFVSVVKAGEASGKMEKVLANLADRMESFQSFKSKVNSALAYPIFIVIAMIVVVVVMMIKVVPVLKTVFEESGAQLPLSTRIIVAISNFLVGSWYFVLLGVIIFGVGLYYFFRYTKKGRFTWDIIKLKAPLISYVSYDVYMARFCRNLGMMIEAGIPIIETIKITAAAVNNRVYTRILKSVIAEVERGIPMSVPLEKAKEFPILVPQMIMVGEQTGKLETLMNKMADYYEDEVDNKIKTISNLIEPVTIVIVGLGVGFIVYSILYPIYSLVQVI